MNVVTWIKIVNHWDKDDNCAVCAKKGIKSGFKLVWMVTNAATNTCKFPLRKKPEHCDIYIVFWK